jgi:hypothetical protein
VHLDSYIVQASSTRDIYLESSDLYPRRHTYLDRTKHLLKGSTALSRRSGPSFAWTSGGECFMLSMLIWRCDSRRVLFDMSWNFWLRSAVSVYICSRLCLRFTRMVAILQTPCGPYSCQSCLLATSPRAPVRSCKVLHCQRGEPSWCALWRCLISNGTPWRHHGWAPGDVEKMWNLDSMQTYASFMLTACTTLAHQIRSDISMDHPVGLG